MISTHTSRSFPAVAYCIAVQVHMHCLTLGAYDTTSGTRLGMFQMSSLQEYVWRNVQVKL